MNIFFRRIYPFKMFQFPESVVTFEKTIGTVVQDQALTQEVKVTLQFYWEIDCKIHCYITLRLLRLIWEHQALANYGVNNSV